MQMTYDTELPAKLTDPELWHRIASVRLPAEPGCSFAERFVQSQNLDLADAEDAVLEYRRFLNRAAVTDEPRLPGELLGLVWQFHALHTSYAPDFCARFLGKPLPYAIDFHDLDPDNGDAPRDAIALDPVAQEVAYRRTRMGYRLEFGQSAPGRFWPDYKETDPYPRALVTAAGIMAVSALLAAAFGDFRVLMAGTLASLGAFVVLSYRVRDSQGWHKGAGRAATWSGVDVSGFDGL